MVGQSSFMDGQIDLDNIKVVHYKLNDTDAKLTGCRQYKLDIGIVSM